MKFDGGLVATFWFSDFWDFFLQKLEFFYLKYFLANFHIINLLFLTNLRIIYIFILLAIIFTSFADNVKAESLCNAYFEKYEIKEG